jgi:enterochelin esterase-like enzyme
MKRIYAGILITFITTSLMAQSGKVFDNLSMTSKILKMDRKYAIYLPPDYGTSERSYPILYLLHGYGDDQTGWIQFGEVLRIADEAIRTGYATPMVIVMPDANAIHKGYVNGALGEWRYEDFFFQEFMPFIEQTYRVKGEKRYRAIAGLSMGGEGTFIYALHHPELFSAACPLSAATGPVSIDKMKKYEMWTNVEKIADKDMESYFRKNSVIYMVNNMPDSQKKAVRWYIDCGDDDFLYEGNCMVHIAMRKNGIPHEYRTRDGSHSWVYWRSALPEVLHFVSMGFHQF